MAELNRLGGLDLFPSLPALAKEIAMTLPEPRREGGREPSSKGGPSWSENVDRGSRHAGRKNDYAERTGSLGPDLGKMLGRFVRDLLEGRLFQR